MRTLLAVLLLWSVVIAGAPGQEVAPERQPQPPAVRFEAVDVYVDSGPEPLAAYQFELAAEVGEVKIVGIEGGEHPAFEAPPYYDPAALQHSRIIIAAFNTGQDLPTGDTRVARVHMMVLGREEPQYVVKVHVAASPEGKEIRAHVTLAQGGEG